MIEWVLPEDISGIKIGIGFNTPEGQRIFDCPPEDVGLASPNTKGQYKALVTVPSNTLMARNYGISIGLWKNSTVFDHPNPALAVSVEASPSGPYSHENSREGLVNINCDWKILSYESTTDFNSHRWKQDDNNRVVKTGDHFDDRSSMHVNLVPYSRLGTTRMTLADLPFWPRCLSHQS